MYQVEYKTGGRRRTMVCQPDDLFSLFTNFGDCTYMTVLSVWRIANGYMERVVVDRVREGGVEVRDLWGNLIEAR